MDDGMKIVVTGSSGLIGSALVRTLRADGHDVRRLVRHEPQAADESQWDPSARQLDDSALDGIEAVVHLAGVGVADKRWSASHKRAILDSRVDGTTTIAEAVARNSDHVRVLLSASAVGWYGDRGDELLDEAGPAGTGFLADVVQQWEAATAAASDAGVRVITMRTGIVLSADGGALAKVLPLFKLGVGGKLGSGRQWTPWIAMSDELAAIRFLLTHDEVSGPVNLSAPEPVRNTDYTAAIGRALHRPTVAAVPRFALRIALADFADEGALVSQRVVPRKLLDAGFEFSYRDIDAALQAIL
jgi:uncharacterized protein (TIGR01777 family)